eukprot:GILI01024064.1.p1 GENE.GILI01024064.1~~GILI01024064.1.p1  ORF type:complete len:260 (+),score=56.13 GILI01024064.1:37-780(+)
MPNCCPTDLKPVESDYKRKATSFYLAGLGNATSGNKNGIIIYTDIFGLHPNAYQLADVFASAGYIVAVPDIFAEQGPWPTSDYPPKAGFDSEEWGAFQKRLTDFGKHHAILAESKEVLTRLGAQKIGAIGMCWGGKVLISAPKGLLDAFACPHPSFFDNNDGKDVTIPALILPSQDEDADIMQAVVENLKKGNSKSRQHRFDDLHHGYLGARGNIPNASDYNDQTTKTQAQTALNEAITFFNENLKE